jgi:hypothetical protein
LIVARYIFFCELEKGLMPQRQNSLGRVIPVS